MNLLRPPPHCARTFSAAAAVSRHTPTDVTLVADGQELTFASLWLYDSSFRRFSNDELARTWNGRLTTKYLALFHGQTSESKAGTDVRSTSVSDDGSALDVEFEDGTVDSFPLEFLLAWAPRVARGAPASVNEPEFADSIVTFDCSQVLSCPDTKGKFISTLFHQGMAKLENAPDDVDRSGDVYVQTMTKLLGKTRAHPFRDNDQFRFQSAEEVRSLIEDGVKVDPPFFQQNSLLAHTDHAFMQQPSFIGAFCFPQGTGVNGWSDSFAVAMEIRKQRPDLYDTLCTVPVSIGRFHNRYDRAYDFFVTEPLIKTCARGLPRCVRFHESQRRVMPARFEQVHKWEEAYEMMLSLVFSPAFRKEVETRPRDMVFFQNQRMLHDRIGTKVSSDRMLVGCYVDFDVAAYTFRREMSRQHPHVPFSWSFGSPEDVLARMQNRKPCYAMEGLW